MGILDLANVHVVQALTDLSVAFGQEASYIADRLAPRVGVRNQSNRYFIWDALREAHRIGQSGRAPGSPATYVSSKFSQDLYACTDHAHNAKLSDEVRANSDSAINAEESAVMTAKTKLLVEKDKLLKTAIDASGLTTATPSGTNWDADGDAVEDVLIGIQDIISVTQNSRIELGMSGRVLRKLLTNATIIERIKAGGTNDNPAQVNRRALAQIFEVAAIHIAEAYENTSLPGAAATMVDIWDNDVYLVAIPLRPALNTLSALYTFTWNPFTDGRAVEGQFVRTWRDDESLSDVFGVHDYYDQKVISADAMYKISNVIT